MSETVVLDGATYTRTGDAPAPAAPAAAVPAPAAPAAPAPAPAAPAPAPAAPAPAAPAPAAPAVVDPAKPADPAAPAIPAPGTPPASTVKVEDYKPVLPEGVEIKPDDPMLTAFLGGAAEQGLSNDAMNALLAKVAPAVQAQLRAGTEAWNALQATWGKETREDPEIGGANLPTTIARIQSAVARFGGPTPVKVWEALAMTGANSNPHIIRMFNNMAAALGEGTPVAPGGNSKSGTDATSAAALLYGTGTSSRGAA